MKFTRLKLTGFKSFCDQTELLLEPGLTGIVGPNGCGKSNLVEALRWVMGESSYKAMRAAGMDEVIFSGSAKRPGRNSAEVTLVLDNADRTAPAGLNTADILEITRRIERDSGSVYRVNGKEVRARDVQLLFADASTGAHSPAMVRQGQIGELIAAKPTARRALLEEAAGISGLHSRRHEAELRLRAAEQNLERVDDIVAQVESQLDTLKRQSRLAIRYRSISGDLRKAEALLFHVRWVQAVYAEKETEAQHGRLIHDMADATKADTAATKALEAAEAALIPLRDKEAEVGAKVQRLTLMLEHLAQDAKRAEARRLDLANRERQLQADLARERTLAEDGDAALARYDAEEASLKTEAEAERQALEDARTQADGARQAVMDADGKARGALEALSQLRARRMQAQRLVAETEARIARLNQQLAEVEREAKGIADKLAATSSSEARQKALDTARQDAAKAEAEAVAAENAAISAQSALDRARPALTTIEQDLGRLESEAQTISRMLNLGSGTWPAIVDGMQVTPGYETALGAALGDDLDASGDAKAPIYWAGSATRETDPPLPVGAIPLVRFVAGPALTGRRLAQIGLVKREDGPRLAPKLLPGQRLVTLDGDLWRWDGLVATADAPTAAAQRLAQRNRLADIDDEIAQMRKDREARRQEVDTKASELERARKSEKQQREAARQAQRAIGTAQEALVAAQKAGAQLGARQSALTEARMRIEQSLVEAQTQLQAASTQLQQAGNEESEREASEALQARLTALRAKAEQTQLALAAIEAAGRLRTARIAQIATEREGWQRRRDSAKTQAETLQGRLAELVAQRDGATEDPAAIAAKQNEIKAQSVVARAAHKTAGDVLARAQTQQRQAEKTAREAQQALAQARENLVRLEERLKGLAAQRQQVEKQVLETLGLPAQKTLEVAGLKAHEALPQEAAIEQKVDRLKAERDRLGGVNLSAEQEATDVEDKLKAMIADRADLIEAIAKLRTGISALNSEGRARLTEAFSAVNAHFKDLFTTLFGGGTAELSFVDSEDPLEAGLEIIARPPGKKPQTMTLLSGGEQALTALSLIFAVFLTNPAPICVLDEVDAPLDDANVEGFCNLLDTMCRRTQTRFLVITHNPITMSRVDRLFGVTMAERGVSQLVSVDLQAAQAVLEAV